MTMMMMLIQIRLATARGVCIVINYAACRVDEWAVPKFNVFIRTASTVSLITLPRPIRATR